MAKAKVTSKALLPILLPTVPSLNNSKSDEWAMKVGFKRLLCQNWLVLAQPQGAEDLIRNFVETGSVVEPGRVPMLVDKQLVHEVLGLHNEGVTDPDQTYPVQNEIPSTGQMRQTKNVADPERRSQFQFYLHNVVHMANKEDISIKNYSRLRDAEEGTEIDWAFVYLENLAKRAATVWEKGGPTVVHTHLRALAQAAPTDPEARKQTVPNKEPTTMLPGMLPKPALVVGETSAGTSKRDTPISFKVIGNPKKVNPFDKKEELVSRKRRRLYGQTPGATQQVEQTLPPQGQQQDPPPHEPVLQASRQQPLEEGNLETQAKQREAKGKGKEKEWIDRENITTINLTEDPDKEEELVVPPSSLETCLEESMRQLEDADEFHRQRVVLHKHMDKINKEAWDKLEIAQRRVKTCVSRYLQPTQNKLKDMHKEEREALQKKHE